VEELELLEFGAMVEDVIDDFIRQLLAELLLEYMVLSFDAI